VLDELAELLHRVQVSQFVPGARGDDVEDAARFAQRVAPDEVQLLYQLAMSGRRDLGIATSPRAAFEMAVLRMLAFRPLPRGAADAAAPKPATPAARRPVGDPPFADSVTHAPRLHDRGSVTRTAARPDVAAPDAGAVPTPVAAPDAGAARTPVAAPSVIAQSTSREPVSGAALHGSSEPTASPPPLDTENWLAAIERSSLRGPARELALNSVPLALEGGRLRLGLKASHEQFRSDALTRQLTDALAPLYGPLRVQFESVAAGAESAADRARQQRSTRQVEAEASIAADPLVQSLMNQFDARVVPNSTRPRNPENER